jgi:hypothetical protein
MAALACLLSVIILRFVTLKWNFTTSSVRPLPGANRTDAKQQDSDPQGPEPEAPQPSAAD